MADFITVKSDAIKGDRLKYKSMELVIPAAIHNVRIKSMEKILFLHKSAMENVKTIKATLYTKHSGFVIIYVNPSAKERRAPISIAMFNIKDSTIVKIR